MSNGLEYFQITHSYVFFSLIPLLIIIIQYIVFLIKLTWNMVGIEHKIDGPVLFKLTYQN